MSNLHFDELDDKTIKLMNDAGITPVKGAYSFNAAINRLVKVVRQDERQGCAEDYLKIMRDAVAREREACAVLCEEQDEYGCGQYAKAIRARGEK